MKNLTFILALLIPFCCAAQVPQPAMLSLKGYGGSNIDQVSTNVTATKDGGFVLNIVSGSNSGTGNIDSFCNPIQKRMIFIKYNEDASVMEWNKCFGFGGDSFLQYIYPTYDGGFVLGGEFNSDSGWGFLICKEDSLGNVMWQKNYSKGTGAMFYDMKQTPDEGYIAIGNAYYTDTNFNVHNSGSLNGDIAVLKLDSLGNKQWSKAIGGTGDDGGAAIILGSNNSYYIIGHTESNDFDCTGNHGNSDVYIARLDSDGNIVWHRDLGGSLVDAGTSACPDGKGGLVVSAYTNSVDGDITHPIGGISFWVVAVDSNNNIVWNNSYGGGDDEEPTSICKATDGSIWVAGKTTGKGGEVDTFYDHLNYDAWFVHADSIGNFVSAKVLGSSDLDEGTFLYPLPGGLVLAGGLFSDSNGAFASTQFYGQSDAFLAVFAPWANSIPTFHGFVSNIDVCPNPAIDCLNIQVNSSNLPCQLLISNTNGTTVSNDILYNPNNEISIKNWPAGIYYVKIIDSKGDCFTDKVSIVY